MLKFTVNALLILLASASFSYAEPLILDGAPFGDLAAWVSDVTQRSVVVPTDLKVNVWLRVPAADHRNALSILRSVSAANGWEMIDKNNMISFSPKQLTSPATLSPTPAGSPAQEKKEVKVSEVFTLSARASADVIPMLAAVLDGGRAVAGPLNTIIVTASAPVLADVKKLLPSLDIARPRYLVSAIITEDYLDDLEQDGMNIEMQGKDVALSSNHGLPVSPLASGVLAQILTLGDFSALYNFLQSSTSSHILSTPYVILDDGNMGNLNVGDNVPILTGQTTTDGQVITTYSREDVGLILTITVKSMGDRLAVEIIQEASSISPSSTATELIKSQRRITTKSSVSLNEIIDFGGLQTTEEQNIKTGIPVLQSIPYFGALFRGTTKQVIKKNLHVFLRISPA